MISEVAIKMVTTLGALDMNESRVLLSLDLFDFLITNQRNDIALDVVGLHEYIDVAVGHNVKPLICLTQHGHNRLLLNNILHSHIVQNGEGELDGQLESLGLITIPDSLGQDGGSVREELSVVLRH